MIKKTFLSGLNLISDLTYNCLGSWPGPNNSRYFALSSNNADDDRPQYRCGVRYIISNLL